MKKTNMRWVSFLFFVVIILVSSGCDTDAYEKSSKSSVSPSDPPATQAPIHPTTNSTSGESLAAQPSEYQTEAATAQPTSVLKGPFLMQFTLDGTISLQDLATGELRPLNAVPNLRITDADMFLQWRNNGCRFLVYQDYRSIVEVNLKGEIIRHLVNKEDLSRKFDEGSITGLSPSPSEEFVAFVKGKGERRSYGFGDGFPESYHYDEELLFVASLKNQDEIYQISEGGKSWSYQWSPDSNFISFLDRDKDGLNQIYIYDFIGKSQIQIAGYQNSGDSPWGYAWSPESEFVILYTLGPYNKKDLQLADRRKGSVTFIGTADLFWWVDNKTLGVWEKSTIRWINADDGEIIHELVNVPDAEGSNLRFVDSINLFACFGPCLGISDQNVLISYDLETNNAALLPAIESVKERAGWISSPSDFPGEDFCPK
jgi:hypothetical protein